MTRELTWERVNVDFLRSTGGRFDLIFSHWSQQWVSLDCDQGKVWRFSTLAEAQLWCAERP